MKNWNFLICLSIIFSSCAITHSPAPIEYNHRNANLRSTYTSENTIPTISSNEEIIASINTTEINKSSEIIEPYTENENYVMPEPRYIKESKKVIYHEVKIGETIEEIASKYKQSVEEIAKFNDLASPYYLEEFQILKIKLKKAPSASVNKNITVNNENLDIPNKQIIKQPNAEFIRPVEGKVIAKFGEKTKNGINKGINIAAKQGTPVKAASSGKVIYADFDATFGNLVIVKLLNKDIITSYAHLDSIILNKNSIIKQGEIIGYVGGTGKVSDTQLHFGIRQGKIAKDPLQYFK